MPSSPTPRLVIGLVANLITVAVFCLYSLWQLDGLRQLQTNTIDRSHASTRQLTRIQNNLNAIGLALTHLSEGSSRGPAELRRKLALVRTDLEAALQPTAGPLERAETDAIGRSLAQLWPGLEQALSLADAGRDDLAWNLIFGSLERQQHRLASFVGGLLVRNQEFQEAAGHRIATIYDRAEREIYLFSALIIAGVAAVGILVARDSRRLFARLTALSERRKLLAQRIIGVHEEVLRSVSRELHDEFGQVLTAVGAILRRAERKHLDPVHLLVADLREVKEIVQRTLDDTRSLSQALHPAILDDYGLERAMERHLPVFEKQTGITVCFEKNGCAPVPDDKAIHVYRVFQEALTNVAKHSMASKTTVRLTCDQAKVELEIEDNGIGIKEGASHGLGLVLMQERAELVSGHVQVTGRPGGGTVVRLEVPNADNDRSTSRGRSRSGATWFPPAT